MSENKIHIQEDWQADELKIFWRERIGDTKEIWYNHDGNTLIATEITSQGYRPENIKPFLTMPLRIGKAFLILLSDKITESGINQKEIDMQAGKTELLISELAFSKEQLVKFINHFTK